MEWKLEPSEEVLRARPVHALLRPIRERRFLYRHYEALLDRLAEEKRFHVVPLRELPAAPRDRVVVALRHDVDERLDSALELARLEHERGLRSTYFVLHTARYYGATSWRHAEHDERVIPSLRALQERGHEVGWHHDLVTLQCVHDVEPRQYLERELGWLRGHGIDVRGCAAHGSYWCHRFGFSNNYFFADFDEVAPGFPNRDVVEVDGRRCEIVKARLAEFGLEYEASHLEHDRYFTDSWHDAGGRRWHPDLLDLDTLRPGDRVIVLVHPCHWDSAVTAKAARTLARGARRAFGLAHQAGRRATARP